MCNFFLIILLFNFCLSQVIELPLNNHSVEHFFANKDITQIKQDRNGFIWISTSSALYRYDGYQFLEFNHRNSKLPSERIYNFFFSKSGDIWILTHILSKLKISNYEITNYEFQFKNQYYGNNSLNDIHETPSNLFIASRYGLLNFNKNTKQVIQYLFTNDKSKQNENSYSSLISVDSLLILVGRNGLKLFNQNNLKYLPDLFRKKDRNFNNRMNQILRWNESIYIASNIGLFEFKLSSRTLVNIALKGKIIHHLSMSHEKIRISSDQVYVFDSITGSIDTLNVDKSIGTIGLSLMDRSGLLWLKPKVGGLNLIDYHHNRIKSYTDENLSVQSFYKDSKNQIWIGAHTGIYQFDQKQNKLIDRLNSKNIIKTSLYNPQQRIYGMVEDHFGNYWVATGNGLYKFDSNYKYLANIKNTKSKKILSSNYILSIETDLNYLWVASYSGLERLSLSDYSIEGIDIQSKSQTSHVVKLAIDEEWLWARSLEGIFRVEKKSLDVEFLKIDSLVDWQINDKLWVYTRNSIKHYEKTNLKLINHTSFDEIDGFVRSSHKLKDKVWYTDSKGISEYSLSKKVTKKYNFYEGVSSGAFTNHSINSYDNKHLFIGKINGFQYLNIEDFEKPDIDVELVLTELKSGKKSNHILDKNDFTIPYQLNDISISFSTLEFSEPKRNEYRYRINDSSKYWQYLGYLNKINFANVSYGKHSIEIQATNNSGVWLNKTLKINLEILPPFWLTNWFKVILVIIAYFIMHYLYKIRVNRILELDRVKQRISRDLHDDLGTSLTKISMFSQLITINSNQQKSFISDIRRIADESIHALDDIVWTIDSRNDSIDELLIKIEQFLTDSFYRINIKYKFIKNIDRLNQVIQSNKRKNIYLIIKEAINNSIKHSNATNVTVDLILKGSNLSLKIQDNGIGINKTKRVTGNGFKNMHQRANQLDTKLVVNTDNGFKIELYCKI